jgi:FMN-dependent NADH-azoreductase
VTLFRLDASIRTEGSVSRAVADTVQTAWQAEHPDARVIHRDLGLNPLPADLWSTAISAAFLPEDQWTPAQAGAKAEIAVLADELLAADAYLFAIPLYNYGVATSFKAWVDNILADPRTGPGTTALAGRPAVLATVRGGGYAPGTPREGWDHSTPYLRRVLADMFQLDLHVVEAELTLAEVNPAMAELRSLAAESLEAAHDLAGEHGKTIAARVAAAA